jgi:hypothetical protein
MPAMVRPSIGTRRALGAAIVVSVAALLIGGCSQRAPALPAAAQSLPGRRHYDAFKCFGCHGADLSGTDKGPSLRATARTWDTDALVRFLAHPDSARAKDPRLQQLARAYAPVAMPGYDLPRPPLQELARYLMEATR